MVDTLFGQLVMPELVANSYWVETIGHGIIPDGTKYLIVLERPGEWLVGWKDGTKPRHSGTLLKASQVRQIAKGEKVTQCEACR